MENNYFKLFIDDLAKLWGGLEVGQKLGIIVLSAITLVVASFFIMKSMEPNWSVLYSDLSPQDAAAVTESLKKSGYPFKLSADKKSVTMEELADYPYLSFEQGEHNSFYYSEEIFSTVGRTKNIRVTDRATLFNLLIGLNGYTVCSGVIDNELNGDNITAIPLDEEGNMKIGYIENKKILHSNLAEAYIEAIKNYIK